MSLRARIIVGFLLVTVTAISPAIHAADIGPDSTFLLRDTSDDTRAGGEIVKKMCAEYGVLQFSQKKRCADAWKNALFSESAAKLCAEDNAHSTSCLDAVMNRRFAPEILEICRLFYDGSTTERSSCLKYFARSGSVFDAKAARLCVDLSGRRMAKARECFNAVRDRDVDPEKLKECKGRDSVCGTGWSECFSDCLERVTGDASPRRSALCAPKARPATGVETGAATRNAEGP